MRRTAITTVQITLKGFLKESGPFAVPYFIEPFTTGHQQIIDLNIEILMNFSLLI